MHSRTGSLIGQASRNDLRIALHYQESAVILYKSDAYQDNIVLPALFLIRQFLELGLKHNVRKLNGISSCDNLVSRLDRTHDLNKIHSAFLAHYRSAKENRGISNLHENKYIDTLNELIGKVIPFDHGSQGFRYSNNKEGKKIIDLPNAFNLKEVFELLEDSSTFLAGISDVFGFNNEDQ